jgi:hypothetical protein
MRDGSREAITVHDLLAVVAMSEAHGDAALLPGESALPRTRDKDADTSLALVRCTAESARLPRSDGTGRAVKGCARTMNPELVLAWLSGLESPRRPDDRDGHHQALAGARCECVVHSNCMCSAHVHAQRATGTAKGRASAGSSSNHPPSHPTPSKFPSKPCGSVGERP